MKPAWAYSIHWSAVNAIARSSVCIIPERDVSRLLKKREWWANVTVAPLETRSTVFSRGTVIGFRGIRPTGGHCAINYNNIYH